MKDNQDAVNSVSESAGLENSHDFNLEDPFDQKLNLKTQNKRTHDLAKTVSLLLAHFVDIKFMERFQNGELPTGWVSIDEAEEWLRKEFHLMEKGNLLAFLNQLPNEFHIQGQRFRVREWRSPEFRFEPLIRSRLEREMQTSQQAVLQQLLMNFCNKNIHLDEDIHRFFKIEDAQDYLKRYVGLDIDLANTLRGSPYVYEVVFNEFRIKNWPSSMVPSLISEIKMLKTQINEEDEFLPPPPERIYIGTDLEVKSYPEEPPVHWVGLSREIYRAWMDEKGENGWVDIDTIYKKIKNEESYLRLSRNGMTFRNYLKEASEKFEFSPDFVCVRCLVTSENSVFN